MNPYIVFLFGLTGGFSFALLLGMVSSASRKVPKFEAVTRRDLFASAALKGLCANDPAKIQINRGESVGGAIVRHAWEFSDHMMKARFQ